MKMKKGLKVGIIILLCIGLLAGCQSGPIEEKAAISATGVGKNQVEPDTASVTISIITEKKDKSAQEDNAVKTDRVIKAIAELGITEDEYETSRVSFYPVKNWKDGKEYLIGYKAENTIEVTTKKLDIMNKVIDASIENGAERVSNLNYSLSDEGKSQLLDATIESAVQDAKIQADAAAKALGKQVTGLKSMTINKESGIVPIYREYNLMKSEAAMDTPINPGEVDYNVSVYAEFYIN